MPAVSAQAGVRNDDASVVGRGAGPNRIVAAGRRKVSSTPAPLIAPDEGHDAWTVQRAARRSSPPTTVSDPLGNVIATPTPSSAQPNAIGVDHATSIPRPSRLPRELSRGGALDLVDRSRAPQAAPDLPNEMEDLFAFGDFTGALVIAELILGADPDNVHAGRCAESCRAKLVQLYTSKIGALDRVPLSALNDADMRWLGLDHRAGFLLSRVDGVSSVEEILDVCGMPRLEALKTLAELLERGAITFDGS